MRCLLIITGQLAYVDETAASGRYSHDIDDQSASNYLRACPENSRRDYHGNVDHLYQQLTTLAPASLQIKTIAYEYDLVSANVHEVKYQEGNR